MTTSIQVKSENVLYLSPPQSRLSRLRFKHLEIAIVLCPKWRNTAFILHNTLTQSLTRSLTHLGKVEFELLAVELGLVQLDASTRRRLRGAEVDPHSPETLEHLEGRLLVVDPEQGLEPLLQRVKKVRRDAPSGRRAARTNRLSAVTFKQRESPSAEQKMSIGSC